MSMHLRIRDSDYFDRRLQLSNTDRSLLAASVVAQMQQQRQQRHRLHARRETRSQQLQRIEPQQDAPTSNPMDGDQQDGEMERDEERGHSHHEEDQIFENDASSSWLDVASSFGSPAALCCSSDQPSWCRRSVATPQPNYVSIARCHSPRDDDTAATRPCSSAFSTQSRRYAAQRAVLIELQPGTGGLDPSLLGEVSSFGTGTSGLGSSMCRRVGQEVHQWEREGWCKAKDKWLHEDRQKDAMRLKQWAHQARIKSVAELRNLRLEEEYRKADLAKAVSDERESVAKEAQEAREQLRIQEHNAVRELRDAAVQESIRRREEQAQHAAALRHLGKLEQASRNLESLSLAEEKASRTRRMQRDRAAARATDSSRRIQAIQEVQSKRCEWAARIRKSESKWDQRLKEQMKTDAVDARSFVSKLHQTISYGARNARTLLEYQNSHRHERIKKEHEAMQLLILQRREAARSAAQAIAEAQRMEERMSREAMRAQSSQRQGRHSPSFDDDVE